MFLDVGGSAILVELLVILPLLNMKEWDVSRQEIFLWQGLGEVSGKRVNEIYLNQDSILCKEILILAGLT